MSRQKKTRVVEETYYEIKCDFCPLTIESKWETVRTGIDTCDVCGKDYCRDHGQGYYDNIIYAPDEMYPEITACKNCIPMVDPIWEDALLKSNPREEPIRDYVLSKLKQELQKEQESQVEEDINNYQTPEYH